ncbi:Cold-shock protein [Vibrio chagasii]|nr:cold shock domain-containing protein [Vibrio alginolyticus]CAH6939079.1 Cold shock domain-containing protein [Vibrio chagasii]CAH7043095.1 Cold-shock protein [Vibrio chagasii]CAH7147196.1 Cold-shock protein [Vibrio chagasii]CAH7192023.1 Cold-shock protein [Vibrio chagasii]
MKGKIVRWNDDRGFGFINPDDYQGDVFVHISKFKKGYRRPQVGDEVEFQVEVSNGKANAYNVSLVGVKPRKDKSSTSIVSVVFIGLAIGAYGYFAIEKLFTTPEYENMGFVCQGKTHCSQMTSCNEAKFYLANCPNVQIDGNRDGVPCEMQWCTN